jgi:hypothetical protein
MRCSANKSCCSSDLSATIRIVGRCRVVPIAFVGFDERPHELCMNQFNFVTQLVSLAAAASCNRFSHSATVASRSSLPATPPSSIVNRRHLYQALLDPGRVGKIDENRAFTVTPSVSSKSYSTRRRGIVGEISDRIFAVLQRGAKRAA